MLTIFGPRGSGYCDRVSRRGFLRVGTFAMGAAALSLADVLRAEAAAGPVRRGHKAVINVGLAEPTQHLDWSDAGAAGFLGRACAPFKPGGPDLQNMTLRGVTVDRLDDRKRLLSGFDQLRRDADASGAIEGADASTALAFD